MAAELVAWAEPSLRQPLSFLDIGAGTGFVSAALQKLWPDAALTAVDQAPQMLRQIEQKINHIRTIRGDAFTIEFTQKFDAIFSNMMLHWLPDPQEALQRWASWLQPSGHLFVALLTDGSFKEWRDLCKANNVDSGLWPMPGANFADHIMPFSKRQSIVINYPSALAFLRRLKATGTATARRDHQPVSAATMRMLLRAAPKPFPVSYEVLFLGYSPQGKS